MNSKRIVSILVLVCALSFGLGAFVSPAFGCGGAQPGSCAGEPVGDGAAARPAFADEVIRWVTSWFS